MKETDKFTLSSWPFVRFPAGRSARRVVREAVLGMAVIAALVLGTTGLDRGSDGTARAEDPESQVPAHPDGRPAVSSIEDVEAGKRIYLKRCAFCHGPEGAGDGPEAATHWPRPRDFNPGTFKIRHTGSGELPTEQDLFLTVTSGMPGSAMPAWKNLLTEKERHQVVAYVMTNLVTERDFQDLEDEEFNVIDYGEQIPSSRESIAKGKDVFLNKGKCSVCHGELGRGDGNVSMHDEWGYPILSADLYKCWNFRGNRREPHNPRNIFREVSTGLNGTPMPSFREFLSIEDRWHVANFVISLCPKLRLDPRTARPVFGPTIRSRYVEGDLPADPKDSKWRKVGLKYIELTLPAIERPGEFVQLLDNIWVKSIFNEKEIAWYIEWQDRTHSRISPEGGDDKGFKGVTNDLLGLLFWNDVKRTLDVWRWESDGGISASTGEGGIGSGMELKERRKHNLKVLHTNYDRGQWQVILVRPLKPLKKKADVAFKINKSVQTDFFAWDGHNGELDPNYPKWEARYKTVLIKK